MADPLWNYIRATNARRMVKKARNELAYCFGVHAIDFELQAIDDKLREVQTMFTQLFASREYRRLTREDKASEWLV